MTFTQSFLLQALLNLQDKITRDGGSGGYAICSFVDNQLLFGTFPISSGDLSTELRRLWVDWPDYSGELTFPVPAPDGTHPGAYFLRSSRMSNRDDHLRRWSGEYGESRKALLNYLIARLQELA